MTDATRDAPHDPSRFTELMIRRRREQPVAADSARYAELFANPKYPRAAKYDPAWLHTYNMGPNVLWLMDALTQVLELKPGMRVLDMGCGTALSSIFLAKEFDVQVWATHLWVRPHENWQRAREAGVADRVFPVYAEAHALPFAHGFFDAAVSCDAYHYFGTADLYLPYFANFVRDGGQIGMVAPGTAVEPGVLPSFHSPEWWRTLWQGSGAVDVSLADMLPGGREDWLRHAEAEIAWDGGPRPENQADYALLNAPGGEHLGFTRIVATTRRTA